MEENENIQAAQESASVQLDAAYVISKIDQIMADSNNLRIALKVLENQPPMDGSGIIGLGNMIEARERTNQEMISLLKRIVDKL